MDTQGLAVIEQSSTNIKEKVNSLVIADKESLDVCNDLVKTIKAIGKDVDTFFDDMIKSAHATHKGLTTKKNLYRDPLKDLEDIAKGKMRDYYKDLEIERLAKEEEIRKEKERLADEAKEALAEGDNEKAEELIIQKAETEEAPKEIEKAEGSYMKKTWFAKVIDKNLVPREYLVVDEKLLNNLAKSLKRESHIPGVKFDYTEGVVVRTN